MQLLKRDTSPMSADAEFEREMTWLMIATAVIGFTIATLVGIRTGSFTPLMGVTFGVLLMFALRPLAFRYL